MARISIDGGKTFVGVPEAIAAIKSKETLISWGWIVHNMDDDMWLSLHKELGTYTDDEFLTRYLATDCKDIIVG